VWEHIKNVRRAIARYLEDVPTNCFRFEENKALFILLIFKGDLKWRYRVDELHSRVHDYPLAKLLLV